jgi:protein TonB
MLMHYVGVFPDSQVSKGMLELNPKRTINPQVGKGTQQSHRLLLALVLLLAALAAVLVKDRDFWFGEGSSTIDADVPVTSTPSQAATKSNQPIQSHTTKKQATPAVKSEIPKPVETPAVITKRSILPPLDVEVVAGSTHKNVHPGSNAQRLEITDPNNKPAIQAATKAAEHQSIAVDAQPNYPPLAQHMNVQGSVILQALIGTDGIIQNLQILHGPAILARAAEQAVREWHFKPIVQNGQAVESKATITVNFTIKVADNSAETTVAEMQAAERLIISR